MERDTLTAEQKLARASFRLKKYVPFYVSILECLKKESVPKELCRSMCVTEDKLRYNNEYVESISEGLLSFQLLHLIAHVGLKHVSRGKDKDRYLWNLAADTVANELVVKELRGRFPGFDRPGSTIIVDGVQITFPDIPYRNMDMTDVSVEKLYNYMLKNGTDKQIKQKMGTGCLGDNDIRPEESNSGISEQRNDELITLAMTKYELGGGTANKAIGDSTDSLYFSIKADRTKKFNWKKYVQKYCILCSTRDSSYKVPDKRMYYQNAIYPGISSVKSDILRNLKVCVDTSGSISDNDIMTVLGIVFELFSKYDVEAELICWDTEYKSLGMVNDASQFERVDLCGRGGTDPSCLFNYLKSKECKVKPMLTIIYTDGYFSSAYDTEENAKKFKDTLWIMTEDSDENFSPSFGKVVKLSEEMKKYREKHGEQGGEQ